MPSSENRRRESPDAFLFDRVLGARLGVFSDGCVIPGLARWQGPSTRSPLYDSLAMGVPDDGVRDKPP